MCKCTPICEFSQSQNVAEPNETTEPKLTVERVQLGIRIEKRQAKVLSSIAQYCDLTAGEMLEDILLHAFEGAQAFGPKSPQKIKELKFVYELDYDAHASGRFQGE